MKNLFIQSLRLKGGTLAQAIIKGLCGTCSLEEFRLIVVYLKRKHFMPRPQGKVGPELVHNVQITFGFRLPVPLKAREK